MISLYHTTLSRRLAFIQMYWYYLEWRVTQYAPRTYLSVFHLCSLNTDPIQFKLKDKMLPHLSFNFLQSHMSSKEVTESHFCPFALIEKGPFSMLMISIWQWVSKNVISNPKWWVYGTYIYLKGIGSFVHAGQMMKVVDTNLTKYIPQHGGFWTAEQHPVKTNQITDNQ